MSKLEETNMLIDFLTTEMKKNPSPNVARSADVAIFTDIAKSLAMIADKLCDTESEDKWIPTSERLPSIGGNNISDDVLITDGDIVYMGYLCGEAGTNKIFWHYYESDTEIDIKEDDIIAWLPLPKPYVAESEDKT